MKDTDFCRRLKKLRTAKGLTQLELEISAELPVTVIAQYESGARLPGLRNIKALCKGLQCKSTDLLGV